MNKFSIICRWCWFWEVWLTTNISPPLYSNDFETRQQLWQKIRRRIWEPDLQNVLYERSILQWDVKRFFFIGSRSCQYGFASVSFNQDCVEILVTLLQFKTTRERPKSAPAQCSKRATFLNMQFFLSNLHFRKMSEGIPIRLENRFSLNENIKYNSLFLRKKVSQCQKLRFKLVKSIFPGRKHLEMWWMYR